MVTFRHSLRRALQSIYTSKNIIPKYGDIINRCLLIKFCAFRRHSVSEGKERNVSNYGKYKIPITVRGKNLFNYTEAVQPVQQSLVDEDGWITLSLDNTSGTKEVYSNFWTKVNNNLKPDTKYYLYLEILEKEGNINLSLVSTNSSYNSQFLWGLREQSGYITTVSDFSDSKIMLRTFASCNAGEKGSAKFRIGVYEEKQDSFEPYYNKTYNIYLDEPLRKLDDAVDYIDFKRSKVVRNVKEENGVLSKLETPKEETIELPNILLQEGKNIFTIGTSIVPSKISVIYNQK